jgi:TonB-linked SusC/RagA family outer membrane protein
MKKNLTTKIRIFGWEGKSGLFFLLPLLCILAGNGVFAQAPLTISGKVTDASGEALPGVNISVKNTTTGTITDVNGEYSLQTTQTSPVLVYSYLGYLTQEIEAAGRSAINVTLKEDVINLSEVVVTALGVNRELRTLGYSTQEVKGVDLIKAREPNPVNSLVGKVAGLTVGVSAEILGRPRIFLRGNREILYVVDGVPINSDTWNLSPDDIESYTVLKGPNAAALYGFRGQNGAILITTKRGSSKKKGFSIDFNSSTMVDRGFISLPMSQDEYGIGDNYRYAFGNHPFDEDGQFRRAPIWGPRMEGQLVPQFDSPLDPETGIRTGTPFLPRGVDNYRRFAETGILSTNNIAFGATTDNADLRVSLSNSYQKGIFPNTGLNITNFNISAGYNFSSKLRFDANMNLSRQSSPNIPDVHYGPNSYAYQFGVYGGAHYDVRDLKDYWQSPGIPGVQQYNVEYGRTNNPYFMAYEWLRGHYKTDVYGFARLTYKFTEDLSLALRTQATTWSAMRTEKFPYSAEVYGRPDRRGDYTEDRRNLFESNTDLLLSYDKRLSPSFQLSAIAGGNVRAFGYNSSYLRTNNLVVPGVYNFSNSENPLIGYNFQSDMLVLSAYGSVDLTYKNFVTLSATGHWDKLSTLPVGDQSYFYPSAAISTVFSDYLPLPRFISFAKARASYANVQGGLVRAEIGPAFRAMGLPRPISYGVDWFTSYDGPNYQNQNAYSISLPYNNQPAANFTGDLANESLRPFSVTSYETGIDLKFLQNRLGLDVTYFTTLNGPQIFQERVANSTGFYQRNVNDIITQKNGWEIALSGTPVARNNFTWNVMVNYSTFVERFKEINNPSGTVFLNNTFYRVGDRVDEVFGLKFLRTPDGQIIHNAAGLPIRPPSGPIGLRSLGFGNSDFVWAINNSFNYKSFNLSFQFDGRMGGSIYNDMMNQGYRGGRDADLVKGAYGEARRAEWESFKETGTITPAYVSPGVVLTQGTIRFDADGNIANFDELTFETNDRAVQLQPYIIAISDFAEPWVISKSFAKLREVVIGYTLPNRLLERTFINSATISLVGRNLLYWAARKDMDMDQYPGPALSDRFDEFGTRLQSASLRRYGINLNVSF